MELRSCTSHPRHPKSDSLVGGAGRNSQPLASAPRGGCGSSPSSLAALGSLLTLVCDSIFLLKIRHSSIGPKLRSICTRFYSNQITFFFFCSITLKKLLGNTAPYNRNPSKSAAPRDEKGVRVRTPKIRETRGRATHTLGPLFLIIIFSQTQPTTPAETQELILKLRPNLMYCSSEVLRGRHYPGGGGGGWSWLPRAQ